MKKISKLFALAVASILGLAACQQEIAPQKPATATHTVTFVAETPQTKTTATITDGVVKYNWTEDDANTEGKFRVFENRNEASFVLAQLEEDGRMNITATFDGSTSPTDAEYTAFFNSGVQTQQDAVKYDYDQNSDVLVAQAAKGDINQAGIYFAFKREVAVAKMTLKGLAEGDLVNNVTIKSDKPLAGTYSVSDWTETSNVINITTEVTANGEGLAEVWFTCIPQDAAQFSVEATTAGGKTYTKEFAKPITLTQGNVKAFGVTLESMNPEPEDNDYHLIESDLTDWRGHYLVAYSDDVFMNGSLPGGTNGVGKASSSINPAGALSTDKKTITAEWGDNHYITIEAIDDSDLSKGYVIKTHSETTPYFYYTDNISNGMSATANKSTAATYPITIEFTNSSDVKIKLGGNASGSVLRYNTSSGQMFRYYKNCGQSAIYLYKKASDYFTQVAVESIALDKTNLELASGKTATLTATVAPANATNKAVKWSSLNEAIATVENGVVTAVAEGTAIITATSEENPAITATCEVTVTAASTGGEVVKFENKYSYGDFTGWSLTNYEDVGSYYKVPSSDDPSVAAIASIFTNKSIQSDVVITLNVATFGSGSNPSASTFSLFADSDCTTSVAATKGGTLPTDKNYKDVTYTITKDNATALVKDLVIKITKPGKQIRLKSITVAFEYSE
ncbi:MAG: Ig domain-containing protein [Candidatus Cryptobacteroides sp.]